MYDLYQQKRRIEITEYKLLAEFNKNINANPDSTGAHLLINLLKELDHSLPPRIYELYSSWKWNL